MPLYDFTCKNCNYTLDLIVSYDNRFALLDCPECKEKNQLEYQAKIYKTSFKLKGTGWYESDFKDTK